MMSKALGHGEVITIDPSLYFNADDMSVMIHTGDKPSREVRAVPHNDQPETLAQGTKSTGMMLC
jgi:hypothetical protein